MSRGCIDIYRCTALRGKIGPDEAEAEDCGGPTIDEVWPDLPRNPEGRPLSPISSSVVAGINPVCCAPLSRSEGKALPSLSRRYMPIHPEALIKEIKYSELRLVI